VTGSVHIVGRTPFSPSYSRRRRVLPLRDAAIAALGVPSGVARLSREHPELLGLTPASAAWAGDRLARFAYSLIGAGQPATAAHHESRSGLDH
jgi:hypothetical protein